MKKTLLVGMGMVAMLSLASAPVFACGENKDANATSASTGQTEAKMVGASGGCTAGTATSADAKMIGDKASCAAACSADMQKYCNMTSAELSKMAGYDGQVQLVPMSIKGMTCGGCESSVTAELSKVPGVVKVLTISYKDATALVLIDPTKAKVETLATTVTNKGYQAEILPAVAHTGANASGAGKTCGAAGAANASGKAACGAKTDTEVKETSAKQPN